MQLPAVRDQDALTGHCKASVATGSNAKDGWKGQRTGSARLLRDGLCADRIPWHCQTPRRLPSHLPALHFPCCPPLPARAFRPPPRQACRSSTCLTSAHSRWSGRCCCPPAFCTTSCPSAWRTASWTSTRCRRASATSRTCGGSRWGHRVGGVAYCGAQDTGCRQSRWGQGEGVQRYTGWPRVTVRCVQGKIVMVRGRWAGRDAPYALVLAGTGQVCTRRPCWRAGPSSSCLEYRMADC